MYCIKWHFQKTSFTIKENMACKSSFSGKARKGSFFNFGKLGSARLASVKARLGSARQKGGSGATLVNNISMQLKQEPNVLIFFGPSVCVSH